MPRPQRRSHQAKHYRLAPIWRFTRGKGITIAVLDCGVRSSSALPAARLRTMASDGGPQLPTTDAHGTCCASLIASERRGAEGVAPEASVLGIQVGIGGGQVAPLRVAQGLERALAAECDVISCSFVIRELAQSEARIKELVRQAQVAGIVVVASHGNDPQLAMAFPEDVPTATVVSACSEAERPLAVRHNAWTDLFALGGELDVAVDEGATRKWRGDTSGATALVGGVMALALGAVPKHRRRALGRALDTLAKETATRLHGHSTTTPRFGIAPAKLIARARGYF